MIGNKKHILFIMKNLLENINIEWVKKMIHSLNKNRFWHVMPEGEEDVDQSLGIFDAVNNVFWKRDLIISVHDFLKKNAFAYILDEYSNVIALLHSKTNIIWTNDASNKDRFLDEAKKFLEENCFAGLMGWQIPTKKELEFFTKDRENPFRGITSDRLKTCTGIVSFSWMTTAGGCDVDDNNWSINEDAPGRIMACNYLWKDVQAEASILTDLVQHKWRLRSIETKSEIEIPIPETNFEGFSTDEVLAYFSNKNVYLLSQAEDRIMINPRNDSSFMQYAQLDFIPCRLPELDKAQLTDPDKGLWELWGEDPEKIKQLGLVARDPARDIQNRAVAIDFGTSSTVVAMNTLSGGRELLRIGVRDFFQAVKAQDFENPTVLECVNFPKFFEAWTTEAYRPALSWDWMRAAHEARERFRDNPGDTKILSSILPLLKQWALRTGELQRKRLTDQQDAAYEMELASHSERNPVRGQPLVVSADDVFDPIELYAWYLGMSINWRGRGIFLKYYLSFPVKYPNVVKQRILSSFRRGLQRSFPQTLIAHHPQVLSDFEVNEIATEPAAYAAAALPHLQIDPTEEGVPYAVFDFGGGTSDFDYGLLRWATLEEEAQGYEQVFEHLGSSGDNYLGGENLLEHLVYESFKQNLHTLRENRIQFTQPIDGQPFAGSEAFLSKTLAAQTNAVTLGARLRSFLESEQNDLKSPIRLDFIDVNGNKKTCEMALDASALDCLLSERIRRGAMAFLVDLARLLPKLPAGAPIHVLLSGNGSRSRHINMLFDVNDPQWAELLCSVWGGDQIPEIIVHHPLPMDDAKPHAPTAKTGVALGLLRLMPGENTLLKNHLHTANEGEAPFAWYVGRMRRGTFHPSIVPQTPYGEWHELGPLQQGIFNLYTTNSPRASNLKEGDAELQKHRLDFPAAALGSCLYARALKPHTLELATVLNIEELVSSEVNVMQFPLELKK